MSDRDIGKEIFKGIQEVKVYKDGKSDLVTHKLRGPSDPRTIRTRLNLSQTAFAEFMGVSVRTVQDWEQNRRQPSGPAKKLLRIAEQHPEVFLDLEL